MPLVTPGTHGPNARAFRRKCPRMLSRARAVPMTSGFVLSPVHAATTPAPLGVWTSEKADSDVLAEAIGERRGTQRVNRERSWHRYSAGIDLQHFERMARSSCKCSVAARYYWTMQAVRSDQYIRRQPVAGGVSKCGGLSIHPLSFV